MSIRRKLQVLLRTLQTHIPWLAELKYSLARGFRQLTRTPFDRDFAALRYIPFDADAIFLDIGANRGQCIDAILMTQPGCVVHSFEPNPVLFSQLRKRFESNRRVILHESGLSDEAGEFTLYVPKYKNLLFDGLASFNFEEASSWLKNRLLWYDEENLSFREFRCSIERLDELNLEPCFIKLDVQGLELPALRGAQKTIQKSKPILLIECDMEEGKILAYLNQFGYSAYRYLATEQCFSAHAPQSNNTFFMTPQWQQLLSHRIKQPDRS